MSLKIRAATALALSLAFAFWAETLAEPNDWLKFSVTQVMTAALFWCFARNHRWAKWIIVLLVSVTLGMVAYNIFQRGTLSRINTIGLMFLVPILLLVVWPTRNRNLTELVTP